MKYCFDAVVNRRGTNSYKYDFIIERGKKDDVLPMWVADMDFPAPPEVLEDIQKLASHGIFGYTEAKEDYYETVAGWFGSRFDYHVNRKEIIKAPGVVFALAQSVRAFTNPGEAVLIQTPVYPPFYDIVRDNGRTLVLNPLIYNKGKYYIDFDDFEHKIVKSGVRLFILCNPHNPVCRVWKKAELERLNLICEKHGVIILSDEIHCDFVWPGHKHTCFGSLNENAVIATAPSKTFNLAGLQIANILVKNIDLREKLKTEINRSGYSQLSAPGIISGQSAYAKGGEWLEELKKYLMENIRYLQGYLSARLPRIKPVDTEGTYLVWLDFSEYGFSQAELDRRVAEGARLWLSGGTAFGVEGRGFQRINIACPRTILKEALTRLEKEFF